jgi:hypothetical protein
METRHFVSAAAMTNDKICNIIAEIVAPGAAAARSGMPTTHSIRLDFSCPNITPDRNSGDCAKSSA